MTFADKVLSFSLLLISLFAVVFQGFYPSDENGRKIVITVDGEVYGEYDFSDEERIIEIKTDYGENIVVIDKDSVWVNEADCPDKLDVKSGKIQKPGQMIVCLPNKMMIEISADKEKVDKVTY